MHEHGRSLVKKLEGKPFVIVGVNCDPDRAKTKATMAKKGPSWRSFWDGGSVNSAIQSQWNIQAYPTMYLIDHKGVIIGQAMPMGEGVAVIERAVKDAESAKMK
jgi:hypothetical protein